MTNNNAILVINAIVNKENMAELPTYLEGIKQVFGKYGAKPVARYKTVEQLAGEDSPEMVSISSFENVEAIQTLIKSEEFRALSELRARVFSKLNIMTCQEL